MDVILGNIQRNIHFLAENTVELSTLFKLLTERGFLQENPEKKFDSKNTYEDATLLYISLLKGDKGKSSDNFIDCIVQSGNEDLVPVLKTRDFWKPNYDGPQILYGIKSSPSPLIGGEEELKMLDHLLNDNYRTKCAFMTGNHETRKMEIAKAFTDSFVTKAQGNCILLLTDEEGFHKSFQDLAQCAGIEMDILKGVDDLRPIIWDVLASFSNKPCLLILANAKDLNDRFFHLIVEQHLLWEDHSLIVTCFEMKGYCPEFEFLEINMDASVKTKYIPFPLETVNRMCRNEDDLSALKHQINVANKVNRQSGPAVESRGPSTRRNKARKQIC